MEKSFEQRLDVESKLLVPDLIPSNESASNGAPIIPMADSIRSTILYREKAKYTEEARQAKISGMQDQIQSGNKGWGSSQC
jgi:hypothetical protein